MLDKFQDCLFDNNLQVLVLEGIVPLEKLRQIWTCIYQEYSDAVAGETELAIVNFIRKIELLQFKIIKTGAITQYLMVKYDEELVKLLIDIGAADSKYPEIPHLQQTWWKRITGRVKRWQGEVDQETQALNRLKQSRQGAGEDATRDSFQDLIVQIEKYVKYPIIEQQTSVTRFIAMIKDYQRYVVALSKHNKK